jgi:hypothetical protein
MLFGEYGRLKLPAGRRTPTWPAPFAICAVAAVSYNVDLFLFRRYVDRNLAPRRD